MKNEEDNSDKEHLQVLLTWDLSLGTVQYNRPATKKVTAD